MIKFKPNFVEFYSDPYSAKEELRQFAAFPLKRFQLDSDPYSAKEELRHHKSRWTRIRLLHSDPYSAKEELRLELLS